MIERIHIENYKYFSHFDVSLNESCTLLVGNNESGKSTLLEAINLGLTKRLNGRQLESELSSHLFNQKTVVNYFAALKAGQNPDIPKIVIELYLKLDPSLAALKGSNNSKREDCMGVRLEVVFNRDYDQEYSEFVGDPDVHELIPTEYFKVNWLGFSGNAITQRSFPVVTSLIDAATVRLQNGTDQYLQGLINETLTVDERLGLSTAYRKMKGQFLAHESIRSINDKLRGESGNITSRDLTIGLDVSQKGGWESSVVPHLDDVPFLFAGKGEQSRMKILLALQRGAGKSRVVLIEEPENHLSFSSMAGLIGQIEDRCSDKQVVIATHSAYVLNKVGLDKLLLLHKGVAIPLSSLAPSTFEFFKKLPGYETLRLILADKTVLVEGASDQLIFQKAYQLKKGKMPSVDGIDVISVGLTFARFLDIATALGKKVAVITDNDGDYATKVEAKYLPYAGCSTVAVCADSNNALWTLEPQIAEVNTLDTLNRIFGKGFTTKQEAVSYMLANKTDCALAIFETVEAIQIPAYIESAIARLDAW